MMIGDGKLKEIVREDPEKIIGLYRSILPEITTRLREFEHIWKKGNEEEIFTELVFCILTPQSKARVCWKSVLGLREKGLLLSGEAHEIAEEIFRVRFKNNKSRYIVEARSLLKENSGVSLRSRINGFADVFSARSWLVTNVKGIGYKESSHFLRNIGKGVDLAILDRHILRNLERFGVIDGIPKALTEKKYLEIEKRMTAFSERMEIPMHHLDLLLWYKEAGEVFK